MQSLFQTECRRQRYSLSCTGVDARRGCMEHVTGRVQAAEPSQPAQAHLGCGVQLDAAAWSTSQAECGQGSPVSQPGPTLAVEAIMTRLDGARHRQSAGRGAHLASPGPPWPWSPTGSDQPSGAPDPAWRRRASAMLNRRPRRQMGRCLQRGTRHQRPQARTPKGGPGPPSRPERVSAWCSCMGCSSESCALPP